MHPLTSFLFLVIITNIAVPEDFTFKPFTKNLQVCFEKILSLEAGYQLSEGVKLAIAANTINIHIGEGGLNEIKLKDIRVHSNVCYNCGHIGHFQLDCLKSNDADTSTPVICQMHHILSVNSTITEAVLKY